ncbi:MAG: hypothetical protein QOE01_2467, partial [Actinomycetota bacterium]|nr:hypothetical protein [Actinomycetota bacterium]
MADAPSPSPVDLEVGPADEGVPGDADRGPADRPVGRTAT